MMDFYGFYTGREFEAYKFLGVHYDWDKCIFRTFAPQANNVELILNDQTYQMYRGYDGNFFEATLHSVPEGSTYEYRIYGRDGSVRNHADPYGVGMELRPSHRSVVRNIDSYVFSDHKWMKNRNDMKGGPLNIYEVHVGSWKKKGAGKEDWYNYVEFARLLVPYLKENHYNYVEFMPLCEHPTDESWGYQNTGYFAPTSRYGTLAELKEAIDFLHNNGIGVILDFVPVHFAIDDYGLRRYDGSALYEYPNNDVGISEWGSCNFMHSRPEVRSFLQSSVNYWLQEYHFDGIRMDAVSRLIYWQGDERRGVNGNAIDFLKGMNKGIKERNSGIMLIAEDSTNYQKVTEWVDYGGLGFDYKWDLGWMHDTLEYFQSPASDRNWKYHKITFSMMYYWNEKYLLPFSHDEVVHGKATILQKMNGNYDIKFPQARTLYMYMMFHPGKKLNFMGNEIGHFREWDESREQDWDLLKYPLHDAFNKYIIELNKIYMTNEALWSKDYAQEGFSWLDCHSESRCIYSILRRGHNGSMALVFNMSDSVQTGYRLELVNAEKAELLLYSDWQEYGGATAKGTEKIKAEENAIELELVPYSGMIFRG